MGARGGLLSCLICPLFLYICTLTLDAFGFSPKNKPKQWLVADELEQVNNTANLTYTRPFDRGYLTNWQSELQVWRRVLGPEGQLKVRAVIRPCPFPPSIGKGSLASLLTYTQHTMLPSPPRPPTRRPTPRRRGCS